VVATARNRNNVVAFETSHPDTAIALALDVTDNAQCHRAIADAERRFGRIDVLVNNAGYCYYAAIEEGEDAAVRALFDTHVFGPLSLIKLVLPGMRARGRGQIINFSSIGGIMAFPGTGFYCAAKFAIEGLSESLAKEIEPLGLSVMVIEPGPFQTSFISTSRKSSAIEIPDYAPTAGVYRHGRPDRILPGDPQRAAKAILDAADSPAPPLRLLLGGHAYTRVIENLEQRIASYKTWKEVSHEADFPPSERTP
jgi:NAD(P)-dependent dehydrogenase (short-subunit alcohol dehydrogenase family)